MNILEALRTELVPAVKAEFDKGHDCSEHTIQVMSIYDCAAMLAIGKRLLSNQFPRDNMHITQSVIEAIRTEFITALKEEFDPEYTVQVTALYDRATALALGKQFMSDTPTLREAEGNQRKTDAVVKAYHDVYTGTPPEDKTPEDKTPIKPRR